MPPLKEASLDIIIFDLEFTAWEGSLARHWSGSDEHREIVEIGAVRIDPNNTAAGQQYFSRLVRPVINPDLSDYFIELTGIHQQKLDAEGVSLAQALAEFQGFASGATPFYSYGNDGDVIKENCTIAGLCTAVADFQFINAREAIKAAYDLCHSVTSSDLPKAVGLATAHRQHRAHRALDDAKAVASVLVPLLASGELKL